MGSSGVARVRGKLHAYVSDPLYRDSVLLILNTGMIAGSGFLFWLVAARLATPTQVGYAGAMVSALLLVSSIARLGLDVALLRFLPGAAPDASKRVLDTALSVTGAAAVLAGLAFALGARAWTPELADALSGAGLVLFLLLALLLTYGQLVDSVFTAKRRNDLVVVKNGIHSVAKIAALFVLVAWLGADGIVLSAVATIALGLAFAVVVAPRILVGYRPGWRLDRHVLGQTLRSSFANYLVGFIMAVPLSLGSLVVLHRAETADVAYYYVLWMFGSVSLVGAVAFGQASLVAMVESGRHRLVFQPKYLALTSAVGIGMLAAGVVLLPLFGAEYARLGWVALLPFAVSTLPAFFLHARLAHLRAAGGHGLLIGLAGLTVACYLAGLALAPEPVTWSGWIWLASLSAGATLGLVTYRLTPAPA